MSSTQSVTLKVGGNPAIRLSPGVLGNLSSSSPAALLDAFVSDLHRQTADILNSAGDVTPEQIELLDALETRIEALDAFAGGPAPTIGVSGQSTPTRYLRGDELREIINSDPQELNFSVARDHRGGRMA